MPGLGRAPRSLANACLRVGALRVVADKHQHLGRSARGDPVRLQQFRRARPSVLSRLGYSGKCQKLGESFKVSTMTAAYPSTLRLKEIRYRVNLARNGKKDFMFEYVINVGDVPNPAVTAEVANNRKQ